LIDARAVVSPKAEIGEDVSIGPYAIIGDGVSLGRGTRIESHVVIKGPTEIGAENHIYQFASIGDDPQDKKYRGEPTRLVIGDRNTIRENCTINRGTVQDERVTRIGDDNWIMACVHIAHDCVIGNQTVLANNTAIAGHVHIDDYVILGGFTAVHQFCRIGESAFSSIFSSVTRDVPAFVTVAGRPVEPRGINSEGLKRRSFTAEQIRAIKDAYRTVYRQGLALDEALERVEQSAAAEPVLERFVQSIRAGSRGIAR
jgi:UDP-N-acetylglucosamine acyltransferase